jgi:anaerobic dimethyl sulfoxide reductase subunit B (iron-sulfur subunit)
VKGDSAMPVEYGIFYTKENCIQCHGCEVACKSWRNIEFGIRWRRVDNIWQGHYPKIKNISASVACMHCAEPVCVEVCPEGAIEKRDEYGIVAVNGDKCTGCQTCLEECPFDAPVFGADSRMQKCDMCFNEINFETESPPCVETCPTKALMFVKADKQQKRAMEESLKELMAYS